MQYMYTECKLPSNGKFYKTTTVHLRPKTIFDIKSLLNNATFMWYIVNIKFSLFRYFFNISSLYTNLPSP